MSRAEEAVKAFEMGYNCAQAIVYAFKDLLDIDEKQALMLASSFGGGMGRLREVCGAVSGMCIVAGLKYGYFTPETGEVKAEHYARIQCLAKRFESEYKSIICRDLLGLTEKHDAPVPEPRTKEYYEKRPCGKYIYGAAEILDKYISEN